MELRNMLSCGLHSSPSLMLLLLLLSMAGGGLGYGSMGPVSAAFGDDGFFCAIDASGKQEIICWAKNSSLSSSASSSFSGLPPMAALTGGEGFMCGLAANTSQPYCWNNVSSGSDLVPLGYRNNAYSHIAAGQNHVCAIRGSYFSNIDSGIVDCWEIRRRPNNTLISVYSSAFSDPNVNSLVFRKIVSGEGFSCSGVREGGLVCWGPKSSSIGVSETSDIFVTLASGRDSLCGILAGSDEVKCWGNSSSFNMPPVGTRFVALTSGARHFCGIRKDDHEIECWGSVNASSVPKGSGFMAIASSDFTTCGVREADLILDCWGVQPLQGPSQPDYSAPLQLCSPGLCTVGSCGEGKFAFNASMFNVPDLSSLCVRKELKICSPCGLNCSEGFFPSSVCTENADRVCTACSLCQNSSCWDVCGFTSSSSSSSSSSRKKHRQHQIMVLVVIIGSSVSGFALLLIGWCLVPRVIAPTRKEKRGESQCTSCMGKPEVKSDINTDPQPPQSMATCIGTTQVFRLSELKDATNGFKEFNELGRGSYGFVYKAVLSDGLQVAVKRANAATIIHTNSRDFEAELEILCKIRHCNIVNLLGYCAEMGERLLVYEYMLHGTLYDHLHGGLSPLNWNLRLKICMQAARGLEYLHKDAVPPIVHRDVKSSNILLDAEWGARIADFGLLSSIDRDLNGDFKTDVYSFGIVLLEILSGRKAYDKDNVPSSIVDWALPLIRKGKAAAIIDRNEDLPRNVEPLLKLADIAELAMKEDPSERPTMSDMALWLEQIVRGGLTF
ncbi:PREDICTED: serine/threonine-protein kinase-like protein CCR1 [Nelumbo nucifera]|uniref:non-specific serine/threonine protein kinase n=1 Tax=Nelumbo nucifera TaxID=4432 RepID=A0A1U7ZP73_NELNU|nr:PREDICTED: serine/threonine-protein kinase-like protein CCR1 [Nelumbo nucifera]